MHKKDGINQILRFGLGYLLCVLVYQLAHTLRNDFSALIFIYATFFSIYLGIFYFSATKKDILFFVGIGIILRFILLFTLPNFSDDLYRFIWDGRLINQGINPFDQLPSYYINNNLQLPGLTTELYQQLNSPNYFTIYPPINQAIFATAAWISPNSIWGSSLVMKSFLFVFEIGSILLIIKLLKQFFLPAKNILLYALNPLIIIEITGNIHFEGAMIFFLLLAIRLVAIKQQWVFSAIAFALSVASKLLPLMFLPLFIRRLGKTNISTNSTDGLSHSEMAIAGSTKEKPKRHIQKEWLSLTWKNVIRYFSIIGISLFLFFIPLINSVFLNNFGESLNLYFQKFEFNASLYYFFRWVGFQIKGYNVIGTLGPTLAITALTGILLITLLEKNTDWQSVFERMLFTICCYLFCTTTVHPWYLALPIVFCVFTNFRFPILWSALIFLTYINYSYETYFENLWIVAAEYLLVFGYLIYEILSFSHYHNHNTTIP